VERGVMQEQLSLDELSGWQVDDDPRVVTDADIDWSEEDRLAEEQWIAQRESDWELASCCGGLNWNCSCYGHGRMTMKDYHRKYGW
jgi:hypothetical protein